jgi:hypothetical protein
VRRRLRRNFFGPSFFLALPAWFFEELVSSFFLAVNLGRYECGYDVLVAFEQD